MTKYSNGFTLIELLIVVVIIGILGSVAMNYYGDNVISANRTEARSALTETSGSLEKCKALYGSYDHANCNLVFPFTSETNLYSVAGVIAPTTFTLTATPVVGESQSNDSDCTTLTLTNTGVKSGTGADIDACW